MNKYDGGNMNKYDGAGIIMMIDNHMNNTIEGSNAIIFPL